MILDCSGINQFLTCSNLVISEVLKQKTLFWLKGEGEGGTLVGSFTLIFFTAENKSLLTNLLPLHLHQNHNPCNLLNIFII